MNRSCSSIAPLLEKYFDREVTDQEKVEMENHLRTCGACRDLLKDMDSLRTLIKAPVDEAEEKERYNWVWLKIEKGIRTREEQTGWNLLKHWLERVLFLPGKVWVPAAAAATLVLFLLVLPPYFSREAPSPTGATAVEYVESQTHNVMVYELEKANVTVIWLLENPEKEETTAS